jgi:hypothetical protein
VEFSLLEPDGTAKPIAWVTSWSDEERWSMTRTDPSGNPYLNPAYLGRRDLITGQNHAAKSGQLRRSRSRAEGDRRAESIEPRSDFLDASVDHTEARKGTGSGVYQGGAGAERRSGGSGGEDFERVQPNC